MAPEVNQVVELVKPSYEAKIKVLLREIGTLFSQNDNASVLVFVERQETAEDLPSKLIKSNAGRRMAGSKSKGRQYDRDLWASPL